MLTGALGFAGHFLESSNQSPLVFMLACGTGRADACPCLSTGRLTSRRAFESLLEALTAPDRAPPLLLPTAGLFSGLGSQR